MKIKQILVVKETNEGEGRVALTPETVALLASKHYRILVESEAGLNAGFKDSEYIKAGAEIFTLTPKGFPANTLILRVKRANKTHEQMENKLFHENISIIGFLDPLFQEPLDASNHIVHAWQAAKINTFSVGLFKSLSIHDPKNMQAAMSRIAGRLAFQDAVKRYTGTKPIKLTVMGTGPAALSAALEARKQAIPVQVFGRQEHYRTEFESYGVVYYVLPNSQNQARFIQPYLNEQTIVIAAARKIGEKATILMDEVNLDILPKGSVVVDLALSDGGNVIGSKRDQVVVTNNEVSIVVVSGYPKAEPKTASEAYAKCMVNLLAEVLSPDGEILFNHQLLQECWVTRGGELNVSLFESFRKF
jgi:NAD/NADP transhydrogenase alpha subunit